jgi:hypothetical protein
MDLSPGELGHLLSADDGTGCDLIPFTDCAQVIEIGRDGQPDLGFRASGGVFGLMA